MIRIYYDSKTGNVERFINKVREATGWVMQRVDAERPIDQPGHLVTFTTRFGEIPDTTTSFLQSNADKILSVSSSGNRNWGRNFGLAADKIASLYHLPLLLKFELSGTMDDIQHFIASIEHHHNDNQRHRQELDFAQ
jgi:protein involved in ribonucleotide reduction